MRRIQIFLGLIMHLLCLPHRCFWEGAECRFHSGNRLCGDLAGLPRLPEETCRFQQRWEQPCVKQNLSLAAYKYLLNFTRCSSGCGVPFFAESSKELEELRGAFARSLDYMKQDVEESRWLWVQLRFLLYFFSILGLYFLFSLLSFVTAGFGESGDPSCLIMQIWARIEVSSVTMTTIFESQMSAMLSPKKPGMKTPF